MLAARPAVGDYKFKNIIFGEQKHVSVGSDLFSRLYFLSTYANFIIHSPDPLYTCETSKECSGGTYHLWA